MLMSLLLTDQRQYDIQHVNLACLPYWTLPELFMGVYEMSCFEKNVGKFQECFCFEVPF